MRRILAIAMVLVPVTASALSFLHDETRVEAVKACIVRNPGSDPSFVVSFITFDQDGAETRRVNGRDVWGQLNSTQKNQIRNIIGAVTDAIYASESVPTPTPSPVPTPTPTMSPMATGQP